MTDPSATEERDLLMMTADVQTSFQTLGRVFTYAGEEVHGLKERVTKVETRLEKVEHRLGGVEAGLANQTRRISDLDRTMHDGFTELKDQIGRMDQRLAAFIDAQTRIARQGLRAGRLVGPHRPRRRRS